MARKPGRRGRKRLYDGYFHPAFVVDGEVVKHHRRWRAPVWQDSLGALPISSVDEVGAPTSARPADMCGETLVEGLSQEEERERAAWAEFDASHLVAQATIEKAIEDTRIGLTWKVIKGNTPMKACYVVAGFQDPAPQQGVVETAGRVSPPSSHLQQLLRFPRRNRQFGVRILNTPAARKIPSIGMYLYVLPPNGVPVAVPVRGNSAL